jgi:putative transposase
MTTMNTLERATGSATPPAGSTSSAGASALVETPVPIEEMAVALMERAREQGVTLVGPGGLLQGLAKTVIESALETELTEHVGYQPYDWAGRNSGNSRNGTRTKTVITDIGPISIDVPRDRDGSFEPQLVRKRQHRLGGIDVFDRHRSLNKP